jgi:hypothetical protein
MFKILEAVVKKTFDKLNEYKGRRACLQYVVENSPEFPQVVAAHLLSLMFGGHINTVSSGQVGKAEPVFKGADPVPPLV